VTNAIKKCRLQPAFVVSVFQLKKIHAPPPKFIFAYAHADGCFKKVTPPVEMVKKLHPCGGFIEKLHPPVGVVGWFKIICALRQQIFYTTLFSRTLPIFKSRIKPILWLYVNNFMYEYFERICMKRTSIKPILSW